MPRLGQKQTEEAKKKISRAMKRLPSWNDGSEKAKKRIEQVRKIGLAHKGERQSLKRRLKVTGPNSGSWKGGISGKDPLTKLRKSYEYRLWKAAVWERDNYECIWCGSKEKLLADHIKPFRDYPELRFAIGIGRTLCEECHMTTDTFGARVRHCAKK